MSDLVGLLLTASVLFVAWLVFMGWIFRSLLLWYWRVDEAVEVLHSIDDSLKQLPAVQAWRARKAASRNRAA